MRRGCYGVVHIEKLPRIMVAARHGLTPLTPLPAPLSHEGSCMGLARVGEGVAGGPHCLLAHFANFLCTTLPAASILSQCVRCSLQMCADATMLRLLWLLVLNNMVPGASGLVFAPALRSTDSPSLRARRRHKGVRVSRAPVPPQHRPSPVSLCGRASYRAHFAPLYGQAWRCKRATPKSLH